MTVSLHTNSVSERNKASIKQWGLYFLSILFLFSSCASHPVLPLVGPENIPDRETFIPEQFEWNQICPGADETFCNFSIFPVRYHGIRIDLTTPELEITAFPSSENDFQKKAEKTTPLFTGLRTAVFSKNSGSTVAFNTSPFCGKNGTWNSLTKLTKERQIVGVHIVQYKELSPRNPHYAALIFVPNSTRGYVAHIIESQNDESLSTAEYAFGGFFIILKNNIPQNFSWTSHDSRTAAGISPDGKTLFILVVEGENPFRSKGLSYPECAAVLQAMGASDALEFDGGGSSDLCVNGRSLLTYPVFRTNAASAGFIFKNSRVH
jgi:hypothetical protein